MKKTTLSFFVFFFLTKTLFPQAPQKLSYQAVIRNQNGELIVNSIIGFKASIIQGTEEGSVVYSEIQTPETNANGLISIEFGGGDSFGDIDWSTGPYFLKTEIDPNGGLEYSISGISQLLSVPYAYYAEESGTPGPQGEPGVGIESIINNENGTYTFFLTDGSIFTTSDLTGPQGPEGTLPEGNYPGEILYWDGSQWMGIAPGAQGQTLNFCNGVPVWGPCPEDEPGTVTDIDGNIYNTVIIGDREWMTENLRVTKYRDGSPIPTGHSSSEWSNLTTGAYAIYPHSMADGIDSDSEMLEVYGALYNWYVVADERGLCPAGWHISSNEDWSILTTTGWGEIIGIDATANELKSCYQVYSPLGDSCSTILHPRWNFDDTNYGTNDYGFSALPAGRIFYSGSPSLLGSASYWWIPDEYSETEAIFHRILSDSNESIFAYFPKRMGHSVRCVRIIGSEPQTYDLNLILTPPDSGMLNGMGSYEEGQIVEVSAIPNEGYQFVNWSGDIENIADANASSTTLIMPGQNITLTANFEENGGGGIHPGDGVTDIDGNFYPSVIIGSQEWMAENLKVSKYRNGDNIPTDIANSEWMNLSTGAFSIYDHNEINGLNSETEVLEAYGALYNWYAVTDERSICPTGWKAPSINDWLDLENYVIDNFEISTIDDIFQILKSCRQINSPLGGECTTWEHPRWTYSPDSYGTDNLGFGTLPGGMRIIDGGFFYNGERGYWWTASNYIPNSAYYVQMIGGEKNFSNTTAQETHGFSLRCIKDAGSLQE